MADDDSLSVTSAVLLDLAGHTITGNGKNAVVDINSGGHLTLTNSVEGAGAVVNSTESGVVVARDGTFTMNGGTISGNSAYDGCCGGVLSRGAFSMTGGTISGNSAIYDGGGTCKFDGTMTVSGSPIVAGNTNYLGTASNVCLLDGDTLVVNGLSAGASLGVTTEDEPTESSPVTFATGATAGDADGRQRFPGVSLGDEPVAWPGQLDDDRAGACGGSQRPCRRRTAVRLRRSLAASVVLPEGGPHGQLHAPSPN